MSLTRRQILLFAGALGGVGLAAAAQRRLTAEQPVRQSAQPSSPQPLAAATPAAKGTMEHGIFNPPRGDVRIVVISDLNSQYGSTEYEPEVDHGIALVPVWKPDLVLCGGDMVAGEDPSLTQEEIRAMWAAFDRHISAPLRHANIPYGFTLGNHDASSAQTVNGGLLFGSERHLAAAYWNDPAHNSGLQFVDRAQFPFYYTFQQNGIFFLVWDASSAVIPAEQIAWAEKSLASPVAQSAKMRIVVGHLPLYAITIGREEPGEYLSNSEELRSMLERQQVHTYISGHDHAYYPAHKGQLELLHCGILGAGVRPLLNGGIAPFKAMTVVDVHLNDVHLTSAETVYTTYNMNTMQLVNQKQLPRLIASPTGKVLRRDVTLADLTADEKAMAYTPPG